MARAIGAALDSDARTLAEPAYHNRHHVAEAVMSMTLLCREALALGLISQHQASLGALAMLGHDLGHDGTLAPDGVLEAASASRVADLARDLPPDDIALLRGLILGTTPSLVPANLHRGRATGAGPQDLLTALANEADVLASLLPTLGWNLSALLAAEWHDQSPGRAAQTLLCSGRRGFLLVYANPTPPACRIGLQHCIAQQLAVLCPEWDALPRAEAFALLQAALAR